MFKLRILMSKINDKKTWILTQFFVGNSFYFPNNCSGILGIAIQGAILLYCLPIF
jgi:hypothetical protein